MPYCFGDFAIWMIENGHAYIDEQTAEQIAEQKGTPTTPGTPSPYRLKIS